MPADDGYRCNRDSVIDTRQRSAPLAEMSAMSADYPHAGIHEARCPGAPATPVVFCTRASRIASILSIRGTAYTDLQLQPLWGER